MRKILTFTGHRTDKLSEGGSLNEKYSNFTHIYGMKYFKIVKHIILTLYKEGYSHIRVGGALGFDTICAMVAIWLKSKENLDLFIELCVPCRNQEKRWSYQSKLQYRSIESKVDKVTLVTDSEYDNKTGAYLMQKRNIYMADGADGYVSCWDGTKGGTKNFIDYANKIGLVQIYNIDPGIIIENVRNNING